MLDAWKEFVKGKRNKTDVQEFQSDLMANVLALHRELRDKTYRHGPYHHFRISDPKPRDIHKASVRDRLLHHAIYRMLYPYFDARFIADSYSCRVGKGTHCAMKRFRDFARSASLNYTKTVWVLKCDVKKFFASIDQRILLDILARHITDANVRALLAEVVGSFNSGTEGTGLPLGNLTSQLLVNVYMNEFDNFIKRTLKGKHYIRYADDFVILSPDKQRLQNILLYIQVFLKDELGLALHPDKVSIKTFASGVDFLGWVHFPRHRVLRTNTKRRMLRRVVGLEEGSPTVQSYLGLLSHGNTYKLRQKTLSGTMGS